MTEDYKFIALYAQLSNAECRNFGKFLHQQYRPESIHLRAYALLQSIPRDRIQEYLENIDWLYAPVFLETGLVTAKNRTSTVNKLSKNERKGVLNIFHDLLGQANIYFMGVSYDKSDWVGHTQWLSFLKAKNVTKAYGDTLIKLFQEVREHHFVSTAECADAFQILIRYRQYLYDTALTDKLKECFDTISQFSVLLSMQARVDTLNILMLSAPEESTKVCSNLSFGDEEETILEGILPFYEIYRAVLKLFCSMNQVQYEACKLLFYKYIPLLSVVEMRFFLRYLQNAASILSQKNREFDYVKELFDLYREADNNNLFIGDGYLSSIILGNVINVSCYFKEYKWATSFLEKHRNELPVEFREKWIAISYATVAYEQGKYENVLKYLADHQFHAVQDIIRAKLLIVRAYYELEDYYKVVEICITAQKKLIKLKKGHGVVAMLAFLDIIRHLADRKHPKTTIEALLKANSTLYLSGWLEHKLRDYKPF